MLGIKVVPQSSKLEMMSSSLSARTKAQIVYIVKPCLYMAENTVQVRIRVPERRSMEIAILIFIVLGLLAVAAKPVDDYND